MSDLYFHLEGDDHETRLVAASSEAEARELCATGFNEQYSCVCGDDHGDDCDAADYVGDEFELRGVYRAADGHTDVYVDDDTDPRRVDELVRADHWPAA